MLEARMTRFPKSRGRCRGTAIALQKALQVTACTHKNRHCDRLALLCTTIQRDLAEASTFLNDRHRTGQAGRYGMRRCETGRRARLRRVPELSDCAARVLASTRIDAA